MITNNCEPFLIDDINAFSNNRKQELNDFEGYGLGMAVCSALATFNQQTNDYYTNLDESQALRDETCSLYENFLHWDTNNHGKTVSVSLLDGRYNTYLCNIEVNSMQGSQYLQLAFDNAWLTTNGIIIAEFHPVEDISEPETINENETLYIRIN